MNKKTRPLFVAFISLLIFLGSCASTRIMTTPDFDSIPVGTYIAAVEQNFGPPFIMSSMQGGKQEYHYLQRIELNSEVTEQTEYIFEVVDGKIVDKRSRQDHATFQFYVQ
jgi:hypothetical protein